MKIAIISYHHLESSLCLAKHIAQKGIDVDYYVVNYWRHCTGVFSGFEYKAAKGKIGLYRFKDSDIPEIIDYTHNLPIHFFLIHFFLYRKSAQFINHAILKKVVNHIRKQKYDAINIVGQMPELLNFHIELKNEKIIHTLHEIGSHQDRIPSTSFVDAIIYDKSPVILHSLSTYTRFCDIKGAEKCRKVIIPFGKFETNLLYEKDVEIDIPIFNEKKPIFLFYGYIKPYKGLDLLKKTMELLKDYHNQFNLIIAGAGEDSSLPYFCRLPNCCVINRFLSNDEMMKLNRGCSMVVLPYHSASQTGIIPTSFLYNKPVIATRVGAFVENVNDGVNGILVEKENTEKFASAMLKCINNPNYIEQLSEGAAKYGKNDEYDWNNIADSTIKFMCNSDIDNKDV